MSRSCGMASDLLLIGIPWLQIEQFNPEFTGALVRSCEEQRLIDGQPVFVITPAAWTWLCLFWPQETSYMPVVGHERLA